MRIGVMALKVNFRHSGPLQGTVKGKGMTGSGIMRISAGANKQE